MSEEKKKRARRSPEEIAAEKREWLIKHEWGGVKDALHMVKDAISLLSDAQEAASTKVNVDQLSRCIADLKLVAGELAGELPPEAR